MAAQKRGVSIASEVLGLELRDEREARRVRLRDPATPRPRDPATGKFLLTHEESERAREEAERTREKEADLRRAAEARAAELEARLRALEGTPESPGEP